jgi:hypothetical protein
MGIPLQYRLLPGIPTDGDQISDTFKFMTTYMSSETVAVVVQVSWHGYIWANKPRIKKREGPNHPGTAP